MTIQFAILGLLSLSPMTGYDLKKIFAGSEIFYWSDNNNLIYHALVELHRSELVRREVRIQENYPARKVYSLTEKGQVELRKWIQSTPKLPEIRHTFLLQLEFAAELEPAVLDGLLGKYEEETQMHLLILQAKDPNAVLPPARNSREAKLREWIHHNRLSFYQGELQWIREFRMNFLRPGSA
jgi:PadR family transcriptional regulator AphA